MLHVVGNIPWEIKLIEADAKPVIQLESNIIALKFMAMQFLNRWFKNTLSNLFPSCILSITIFVRGPWSKQHLSTVCKYIEAFLQMLAFWLLRKYSLFFYSYCRDQKEMPRPLYFNTTNVISELSDQKYILASHWSWNYKYRTENVFKDVNFTS